MSEHFTLAWTEKNAFCVRREVTGLFRRARIESYIGQGPVVVNAATGKHASVSLHNRIQAFAWAQLVIIDHQEAEVNSLLEDIEQEHEER